LSLELPLNQEEFAIKLAQLVPDAGKPTQKLERENAAMTSPSKTK